MTPKVLQAIRGSKGPVGLGKLLGRGGEGAVHEILGSPDLVAKIYHQQMPPEKADKIEAMAALKSDRLLSLAAWPLEILRTPQGAPVGLLMPRVEGHKDIHNLYSPRSRKAEFPAADWRFLIRSAANTARAFAAIHESGCVIGDVNHGGVCVSDKATVRLIDCDSFQVAFGGRRFLCEVGVPTFTPPELQGKPFRGVVRTPNHDNFGLAVLIFHLLFMGRHPFAGRFLGGGDISIEKAIGEFRFAYGVDHAKFQMEPPPNVPSIGIASGDVASLFERAFSPGGARQSRPGAIDWISCLDSLERQLKTCHVNSSHHYTDGLDHCPWCRLEAATGAVFFSFVVKSASLAGGDIASAWARIIAVPDPGPAPPLSDWRHIAPSAEAIAIGRSKKAKKLRIYGGLFSFIAVLMLAMPAGILVWMLVALVATRVVHSLTSKDTTSVRFRDGLRIAEDHCRSLQARWDQDATDQRFTLQRRQLDNEHEQLRNLPSVRRRRYQQLENARERDQRRRFLEGVAIERAKIAGIGPSRKAMLASFNIETAWDVTEKHVKKVPGFGPALTRELLSWRNAVEAKFRFDPTKGVDPQDVASLDREIADIKQKLERSILSGAQALTQINDHILAQRSTLRPLIEDAAKALAQAKADLRAAC